MNRTLSKLALATSLTFAAAAANAGDNFVGLTWGQTDNNIQKSSALNSNLNSPKLDKVINDTGTWGLRAGQVSDANSYYMTYENVSDTDRGNKLDRKSVV